jgi:hypothetical protein
MRFLAIAAGALALSAAPALAQPTAAPAADYVVIQETYPAPSMFGEESLATNYQAIDAGSVAPGFAPQSATQAKARTPNIGMGASRSQHANQG